MPAVPSGSRLLTRPSSSSAPAGAGTPESQLGQDQPVGRAVAAARSRRRSAARRACAARRTAGCRRGSCRARRCGASQAPSSAASTRPAVASPPASTVTSSYSGAISGTSAPSVARPGPRARVTCRRPGGGATCGPQPGAGGRGDAEHAVAERREQRPRDRVQPARRDDHDRPVAQVSGGRAEQRVLESAARPPPGWPARWPGRPRAGCGPGGAARSGRNQPPGWRPRRGRR